MILWEGKIGFFFKMEIALSLGVLGIKKLAENERSAAIMRYGLSFVFPAKVLDSFFDKLNSTDTLTEQLEKVTKLREVFYLRRYDERSRDY